MSETRIPLRVVENEEAVALDADSGVIRAVSPTVDLERVTDPNPGVKITVKDVRGEHSETVLDGSAGDPSALIDDTAAAAGKTYSSNKIEAELTPIKSAIDELSEEVNGEIVDSINLLNTQDADIINGGYIDKTGTQQTLANYNETGFIPCVYGDTFTLTKNGSYFGSSRDYVLYDANKEYIFGDDGIMPTVTVGKSAAKYIRFPIKTDELPVTMIVKNDTAIHEYVPYGKVSTGGLVVDVDDLQDLTHPWKNKAVVCFGDSIMYNDGHNDLHGYPYYLEPLGFTTITNKGKNGACIAYHSERVNYEDICTTVDSVTFTNYDLAIIAGGTNDFGVSSPSPIGSLVNSTTLTDFDKTTVIGALQYTITTILTAKPSIKIVLFTPLKRNGWYTANSQGKVLKDYADAIKTVADYYSIPVLDYYQVSGFNRSTLSTMTSDGLHPNNDGYKYICEKTLTAFINSMMLHGGTDASGKIDAPASPSSGDFLCYNGTAWVATTLSAWQGGSY